MMMQLDLFAEAEAEERERRFDSAPSIFDMEQRGYFTRLAEFAQWQAQYDNFDSIRRSHAWHESLRLRGQVPTEQCRPVTLAASLGCGHYGSDYRDCQCVGGSVYRGACTGCSWEGPVRGCENRAAEDAHDHSWPGWRELPVVPPAPESGTSKAQKQRWIDAVAAAYPDGWLVSGGPILTSRGSSTGTRHAENRTPFGGYDMCVEGTYNADDW
ncbi:DUF6349 family protein [Mycolicibacter sinensis]|uniref:Uncharacterized protein n=1 Tax=Mycolicibacter sinensis (strain JDM601) TaxID=875328 RepID=A0A1A2XTJ7_MYCSD|nr:DUF6349 family protein [Mycolicibacter sinensis]OBI29064.1 hypothetical protein A5710_22710 [Mycolicibacter sinensis]